MLKRWSTLLMLIFFLGAGLAKEKKPKEPATDFERMVLAAKSCDMPALNGLIARGVDVNAVDDNGDSVLTFASSNRLTRYEILHSPLKCPETVTALINAGADPWKAKLFLSPLFNEGRPRMIGILRVEDTRENKGESAKLVEEFTNGIERAIHRKFSASLRYPILPLSEVRQSLRTTGFSEEDTLRPDRVKACKALSVDAVFEATLKNFRSKNAVVVKVAEFGVEFTLTDCQSGQLWWRRDIVVQQAQGWLVGALESKWFRLCVDNLTFPDFGSTDYWKKQAAKRKRKSS